MMELEYENSKKAYEEYNINSEYKITEKVLGYIRERIVANESEIEDILKLNKRKFGYKDVLKCLDEEIEKRVQYKSQINLNKREDNFVYTTYLASIGVAIVECYSTIDILKYMIKSIKTRSTVIISDIEFKEDDDKHLLLMIIRESLKKFNIDCNIVQILPYEECDYTKCDKVIYTYQNKKKGSKEKTEKLFIYLENEDFREEANREYETELGNNKEVQLLEGNIDDAIDTINSDISKGAIIYTKDTKKAYKFLNIVRSRNVFINATFENIDETEESEDELLMNKKIMYELK